MTETAYTRTTFDGKLVNARTRDALKYAQALWRERGGHRLSIRIAKGISTVDAIRAIRSMRIRRDGTIR